MGVGARKEILVADGLKQFDPEKVAHGGIGRKAINELAARAVQGYNAKVGPLLRPKENVSQIMAMGGQEAAKPLAKADKANTG